MNLVTEQKTSALMSLLRNAEHLRGSLLND